MKSNAIVFAVAGLIILFGLVLGLTTRHNSIATSPATATSIAPPREPAQTLTETEPKTSDRIPAVAAPSKSKRAELDKAFKSFMQLTGAVFFLVLIGFGVLYFIPASIARVRSHCHYGKIFLLNFFLGWTGLGWLAALIWACTGDVKPKRE